MNIYLKFIWWINLKKLFNMPSESEISPSDKSVLLQKDSPWKVKDKKAAGITNQPCRIKLHQIQSHISKLTCRLMTWCVRSYKQFNLACFMFTISICSLPYMVGVSSNRVDDKNFSLGNHRQGHILCY